MLEVTPIGTKAAGKFVGVVHRHHGEPPGGKYAVSAEQDGKMVGVAIGGRPVSRQLDNGCNAECTRLCTDGTDNVCSFLYGATARIAKEMGYRKIYTYFLASESGESLRAPDGCAMARPAAGRGRGRAGRAMTSIQPSPRFAGTRSSARVPDRNRVHRFSS